MCASFSSQSLPACLAQAPREGTTHLLLRQRALKPCYLCLKSLNTISSAIVRQIREWRWERGLREEEVISHEEYRICTVLPLLFYLKIMLRLHQIFQMTISTFHLHIFLFFIFLKVFLLEKHVFLFVFHYMQNYIAHYGQRKPVTTFYNHSHQFSEIFLRIRILILTTGLFSCNCNTLTK